MSSKISYFGAKQIQVVLDEIAFLKQDSKLTLESGKTISNFPVAYKTIGKLNKKRNNAILIFHGLTADQYVVDQNPVTGKSGWWAHLIGPYKAIDTNKYFVICSNVLGGCMGTLGPKEKKENGEFYNLDFPVITIGDMVSVQKALIEHLGIEELFAIVGGSLGGMMTLEWSVRYPDSSKLVIPIATSSKNNVQNIAFNEMARQAIMSDPDWCNGDYLNCNKYPSKGLALARMIGHITYSSYDSMTSKFGRNLQEGINFKYGFGIDFQVESYLQYQGSNFVTRFDPNSYLYMTKAVDYFDLFEKYGKNLDKIINRNTKYLVVSFSSDWLFPTKEAKLIVKNLLDCNASVSFVEFQTNKGHDAFLLNEQDFINTVGKFIDNMADRMKL